MNLEIITDGSVQSQIVAFAIASTQLVKPGVTNNRAVVLPLLSVVLGLFFAAIVIFLPKEFYPLLTTLSSLVTGTGGVGLAKELTKKPVVEAGNPPDHL